MRNAGFDCKKPDDTIANKAMCSVWIFPWVLLCLFSSGETTNSPPKIILDEQIATRQEGSHITINCKYIFQEQMQLLWIKDPKWNETEKEYYGVIVYSNTEKRPQVSEYSDRVEFLNNRLFETIWTQCTLKINHLKKNDSGIYAFRYIRDGEKYLGSKFELMITDNPCNIHIKPQILKTLKEGDAINISCTTSAACETHPKWQWSDPSEDVITEHRKDEKEIYTELKYNVSWTDDGRTLTCRPSRCSGDDCVKRSVTLRVEHSPKQTEVIGGSNFKDVKEGEQLTISCSSNAHPKANFTWFKRNGSFSQTGENLTFLNITTQEGGMFYCQAKNEYGTDTSLDININIIYVPKGVNISPKSMILTEGDHLTLTCTVQKSNPAVEMQSYRWYKNGQEIYQQTGNTFILPRVTRFDKGSYQCQARNSVGETMSTHTAEVNVEYVPQNANIEGTSRVKLNLELHLECVTEADPLPNKYSWYFKPEHKQQFVTLSHIDQVYRVNNVAVSDAGSYQCSAQNTIGSGKNSAEINVLVLYPPKQPNLTMKHVAKENEDYHITCNVESFPESELTLTRNDKTLKNVQLNFLKFSVKVSRSDAGVYKCLAKNSEGENSSENHLKVLYAPKDVTASAHPSEELKEGSDLTLTCKAYSVPQVSDYTWKKSGTHPETVGHGQKITLHSLKSSDSGNYNCISSNEIGSASSSPIYIRVKYRPSITLIHNMTLVGLWEKLPPIHLTCSVLCYPPATSFAWYKLEDNNTVLSVYQNYTVQPENPGTYYCFAKNDVGNSTSEPLQIYLHHIIIKRLIQVIISLLVILSLIGVIFLLHSFCLKKRKKSSGNNNGGPSLFSFSAAPLQTLSNFRPSGLHTNTRENLVMEGSAVHSNPPANSNRQAGRPNHNIHTVYDAVKLPPSMPKQHHYTEEDLNLTTVNYAALQFNDSNNPNKSAPSNDDFIPVYAKVLKNKQITQEQQGGHEDYENMFAACTLKQPLPNIDWDSDSSESEDEVNYTKVSFTAIQNGNPRKDTGTSSSDEEGKIEYTEVKI
ncbi:B-cell receptor CD22 isoform X2 [Clarias gariepinus]|uniref:B-cell receptor CD22 isoform X2 n=2 Tax=Clarias gariepinus TaxID=13013 RepID=UPI00234D4C84|nr:B-cell receptor CD22 isoform X2 [Clarias gariepinus]